MGEAEKENDRRPDEPLGHLAWDGLRESSKGHKSLELSGLDR
jgi:hypothetical protein